VPKVCLYSYTARHLPLIQLSSQGSSHLDTPKSWMHDIPDQIWANSSRNNKNEAPSWVARPVLLFLSRKPTSACTINLPIHPIDVDLTLAPSLNFVKSEHFSSPSPGDTTSHHMNLDVTMDCSSQIHLDSESSFMKRVIGQLCDASTAADSDKAILRDLFSAPVPDETGRQLASQLLDLVSLLALACAGLCKETSSELQIDITYRSSISSSVALHSRAWKPRPSIL
jgi:hypothetical protein